MCKYCDISSKEFLGKYYNDKNYGESETEIADTRHEGCKIVLYHGNHVIVVRGNYEDFSEPINYCPFCGKEFNKK